jgi:hypothetical protein
MSASRFFDISPGVAAGRDGMLLGARGCFYLVYKPREQCREYLEGNFDMSGSFLEAQREENTIYYSLHRG